MWSTVREEQSVQAIFLMRIALSEAPGRYTRDFTHESTY